LTEREGGDRGDDDEPPSGEDWPDHEWYAGQRPTHEPYAYDPDESPSPTPSGKRFRAATEEELDPNSWIISDDRSALRAVLRGGSVSHDRGDATFIGSAIRDLARMLREAAEAYRHGGEFISDSLLRHFAWHARP
jgi:hypothetical protein